MSEENSELVRKKNTIKRLFKNWENITLEGNRQQELNKWLDTPEISECTKRLNILSLKREKDFLANPGKYMTSYELDFKPVKDEEYEKIREEWENLVSKRMNSWFQLKKSYGDCSFIFQDLKAKFLYGNETPKSRLEKDRKAMIDDFEKRNNLGKKPFWKKLFGL
jgi:hypothetical protein